MARMKLAKTAPSVTTVTVQTPNAPSNETEATKPDKPDFWTYMKLLSEEDWKTHIVYLTRVSPKTGINGLGGYLVKLVQPFDIEDIKNAYGGYEFSYIMKKGTEIAYTGRFSIEAPPKFDPTREQSSSVANTPGARNSDTSELAKEVAGILREQLEHERERNDRPNPATDRSMDMIAEASKQSIQIVKENATRGSNATSELRELIGAMKEMGIIGGGGSAKSTLGALIQELTPLITLLTPLLGKFFTPQDPLTQASTFLALMGKMDEVRGAAGGSKGATTNDLIIEGIRSLPTVLQQMSEGKQTQAQIAEAQRARAEAQRETAARIQRLQQPPATGTVPMASPGRPNGAPPAQRSVPPSVGDLSTTPINRDGTDDVTIAAPAVLPAVQSAIEKKTLYDQWIKEQIYAMIYMELEGSMIAEFLDTHKPEQLEDLRKFSAQEIEQFFAFDPILAEAVKLPGWPKCILEAKVAAAEMLADDEEEVIDIDRPKAPMAN